MTQANPMRGEASILVAGTARLLRPSFQALTAAEEELGPLFALVERAADGRLKLSEMAALFWHCLADPAPELTRERLSEALVEAGLVAIAPALNRLIAQILQGRG